MTGERHVRPLQLAEWLYVYRPLVLPLGNERYTDRYQTNSSLRTEDWSGSGRLLIMMVFILHSSRLSTSQNAFPTRASVHAVFSAKSQPAHRHSLITAKGSPSSPQTPGYPAEVSARAEELGKGLGKQGTKFRQLSG